MDNQLIIEILLFIRNFINTVFPIFTWGLIIYILSSWLPALRESSFGQILGKIYEPILEPVRKLIPPLGGMLDLSPIILIIGLNLFLRGLNSIFQAIITALV
ncbi:YggT family protein [Salinicoccus halodurans]|uniref:Cell division protein n=1 Tax=Salinicoccus halodurans TaxID=407035 RepID=A0A0F7HKP1_9STAP|nr:YggT family protein [Salinicoccus halodurans]AKG73711.1 cell division protein [Salinicoccus halodurans]SFK54661.1 YggT family protein [Salinicoccus halodurans]